MTLERFRISTICFFWLVACGIAITGCQQDTQKNAKDSTQGDRSVRAKTGKGDPFRIDLKKKVNASGKKDLDENREPDFTFVWHKETGVDFVHQSGFDEQRAFPAANGSGIGVIDFDRDGLEDVYFGSGKAFPLDPSDGASPNQIYRNLDDWKFRKSTGEAGVGHTGYTSGIAIGDFDNDGFSDIYVGCYGENVLYRNQGDGSFIKVAGEGVPHGTPARAKGWSSEVPDTPGWATSCVFFDYNHDGALDIYVGNYGVWNLDIKKNCGNREKGQPRFCSPTSVRGQPDVLYENNGDGTFTDVSVKSGIYTFVNGKNNETIQEDYRTQGVIATDFNNDGLIDLYCGNDMHANLLLINSPTHVFENKTELSSTGYGPNGGSKASMGVAAADVNNDGHIDLFCTNFSEEYNSFYKGLGNLQFAEVARANRLGDGARPWVGWGTEFVDLDSDGWLDVIVTNGHVDPNIKDFEKGQQHLQPCLIWKNNQGRFALAKVSGDYFAEEHPGRALARADFDNDGDADFVVGHQDQPPAFLENRTPAKRPPRNALYLVGTRSNRDGIGANIQVSNGNSKRSFFQKGGGSYLSTHTLRISNWTEKFENNDVLWPSGQVGLATNNPSFGPLKKAIEPLELAD